MFMTKIYQHDSLAEIYPLLLRSGHEIFIEYVVETHMVLALSTNLPILQHTSQFIKTALYKIESV